MLVKGKAMLGGTKQPNGVPSTVHASSAVIEVNERGFEQEVLARSQQLPIVIDFWAPWCGPCRTLGPTLERLAVEAKGAWMLAKVNVDENPRLQQAFRVQSIPAVMAVRQGKLVDQFVGALPESQIRAWLKRFVPEPGGSLLEAARELEASDAEGAMARYRLLLGEEPTNADALFALGRLLLLKGSPEGVATLKELPASSPLYARAQAALPLADFVALGAGPPDGELDARYRFAGSAAAARDYGQAFEALLAIVARDRSFRNDGARKALLALFAALGDEHPLVPAARRKLASTLF